MANVDERLSYFRQLSAILGAVSLIVGFLLVTTLVTVSVNERVGEIVVMRAIGVSRAHVVQQIVLEGTAMSVTGAVLGTGLGLVTARYLNTILSRFPGLTGRHRLLSLSAARRVDRDRAPDRSAAYWRGSTRHGARLRSRSRARCARRRSRDDARAGPRCAS